MTAVNANSLFDPGPPRHAARGATPQVQRVDRLDRPNPAGRYEITYRYRPLHGWTSAQIAAAERVARMYFEQLGGFRVVDDALMRIIITALADDSFENLLHAVYAKRRSVSLPDGSLKESARKFLTTPHAFFARPMLDSWVEKSKQFRDQQAARNKDAQRQQQQTQAATLAERAAAFWVTLGAIQTIQALDAAKARLKGDFSRERVDPESEYGRGRILAWAQKFAFEKWGQS